MLKNPKFCLLLRKWLVADAANKSNDQIQIMPKAFRI